MIYFTQILTVTVGIDLYSAVQVDRASSPADQPFPAPRARVVQQAARTEQVLQDSLASILQVDRVSPADPAFRWF